MNDSKSSQRDKSNPSERKKTSYHPKLNDFSKSIEQKNFEKIPIKAEIFSIKTSHIDTKAVTGEIGNMRGASKQKLDFEKKFKTQKKNFSTSGGHNSKKTRQ